MQKFILPLFILFVSNLAWAVDPVIRDTLPPCDSSPATGKPPCSTDSDSINIPPKTPDDKGVIVPPEIPPQGLPNRTPSKKRDLTEPKTKSENPEIK